MVAPASQPASHTDNDVVTLSVDQVTFLASINYTGTSSMEAGTSTAVFSPW